MFRIKKIESEPVGVYSIEGRTPDQRKYRTRALRGTWWRVWPENWRDIRYLQSLTSADKAAPARGEGVLVSNNVVQNVLK